MKNSSIAFILIAVVPFYGAGAETDVSNWVFRGGIAQVSPNDDSGGVLGGGVGVDSATGVGVSFTYLYQPNWGVEVLGALPFTHDIRGTGALAGLPIGETRHLPPTVSLVYNWGEQTQYRVGAGVNYTQFFDEKTSSALDTTLGGETDLKLDASVGLALQVGFDTPLSNEWSFSGTLYYMDIGTEADVLVDNTVAATVDVDIDPWVLMLGVSTHF